MLQKKTALNFDEDREQRFSTLFKKSSQIRREVPKLPIKNNLHNAL
jgi:hypothetical protein